MPVIKIHPGIQTFFPVFTGLISFNKFSFQNQKPTQECCLELNNKHFCSPDRNSESPEFQNLPFCLFISVFKLIFKRMYNLEFFHQGRYEQLSPHLSCFIFRKMLYWEWEPCIRILIAWNLQKRFFLLTYLATQIQNFFFSKLRVRFFSSRSQLNISHLYRLIQLKNCCFLP